MIMKATRGGSFLFFIHLTTILGAVPVLNSEHNSGDEASFIRNTECDASVPRCTLACPHHRIKGAMNSNLINSRLLIGMHFNSTEYVDIN